MPVETGIAEWLRTLAGRPGEFSALLASAGRAGPVGFENTIREICQQPATWTRTAAQMQTHRRRLKECLAGRRRLVLTGSGSSQFAGECVAPMLRRRLRLDVSAVGGGELLLRRGASVCGEPTLVVSLARSGDSPESVAVLETLLETEPDTNHLVLTCNADGRLARQFAGTARVTVATLGDEVNDRSLVMTSSFTNLALAAGFLGWLDRGDEFARMAAELGCAGRLILETWPDRLAEVVSGELDRAVFLAGAERIGAAREASLKLLEMTAGRVATMWETYLGVRHGPMCFIGERTLVVCFLSSDPLVRRYEADLIAELNAKQLGARKLLAGAGDPADDMAGPRDLPISYPFANPAPHDLLALLDVMLAQLLGFHRSRIEGLPPDSPSVDGVISRVVNKFEIHRPGDADEDSDRR